MRKMVIIAILLIGMIGVAQERVVIPKIDSTEFEFKNGKDEYVVVEFTNVSKVVTDEMLFKMVAKSMVASKYKLKNKRSFIPLKCFVYDTEDNRISVSVKMVGQNSYGVESEMTYYSFYKLDGTFISDFAR